MNILMLSATFPYPPTRGGTSVRTFNLLKHLKQQGHHIALATHRTSDVTDAEVASLKSWVDELAVFPRPAVNKHSSERRGALGKVQRLLNFAISGVPPSVRTTHSKPMQSWVTQQIETGQFDAITCEHSVNEAYVPQKYR